MPRFFTQAITVETAFLYGDDARHIAKSLRMRPGEELTICDMQGTDYDCVLDQVTPEEVAARITGKRPSRGETRARLILYQALPKGDKLDFIVQKATELGAAEIVPVLTSRCISRPDGKSMEKKRKRLEKIALEAAKQSGRGRIPSIGELADFEQAVKGMKQAVQAILFYEGATVPLRGAMAGSPESVAFFIGSEGGFSPEEAAYAESEGVALVSLGSRILRCETAPVCALSMLLYALGED